MLKSIYHDFLNHHNDYYHNHDYYDYIGFCLCYYYYFLILIDY